MAAVFAWAYDHLALAARNAQHTAECEHAETRLGHPPKTAHHALPLSTVAPGVEKTISFTVSPTQIRAVSLMLMSIRTSVGFTFTVHSAVLVPQELVAMRSTVLRLPRAR